MEITIEEGTFDPKLDIEAVVVERVKLNQKKYPDTDLVDKVILKDGPRAYKVALYWIIVDRNTGEIHHHSLRIETYRRTKAIGK